MENQPFFSIIIPNYKTEQFLEQCLKSVIDQEFTNFECILLNDGSPGMPLDVDTQKTNYWSRKDYQNQHLPPKDLIKKNQAKYIFDKVSGLDSRFTFLSHDNIGQGPTRQKGIEKARGKRVVFLDCDDFLDSQYLQKAYDKILTLKDWEICFAEIENYQDGKKLPLSFNQKFIPKVNNLASMLTFPTWSLGPINYFWQIDILKKQKIQYLGGRGEDTKFFFNCFIAYFLQYGQKALQNFQKIPKSGYNYRLFEYQNYRAPNFEQELFLELTSFVKNKLLNLQKIGFKYYILGILYFFRFRLYRIKLNSKNLATKNFIGILATGFTLLSIIISQTTKENA